MNSEYSNNPLTEVALALSMAFFSIMVLTIFALSHKSKTATSNEKISISVPIGNVLSKKLFKKLLFLFTAIFINSCFQEFSETIWNIATSIGQS